MTEQIHVRARKFLQEFFSDEELNILSSDYFPYARSEFTLGMRKSQKVQILLEYVKEKNKFDVLLAALEKERPRTYPDHFAEKSRLIDPEPEQPKEIERNPYQIFISHAHQDADFAQRLAADLQANGWQTWMAPDNIRPGEKWVEAIERGLAESGIFALVITPESVNSRWVQTEVRAAIDLEHRDEIRMLPLKLKSAAIPTLWRTYQWIAFESDYISGLKTLLDELDSIARKLVAGDLPVAEGKRFQVDSQDNFEVFKIAQTKTWEPVEERKLNILQALLEIIKRLPFKVTYDVILVTNGVGKIAIMIFFVLIMWLIIMN